MSKAITSDRTKRKVEELESIRGIAAFLVVFYHVPKWSASTGIGIVNNAYLMVELFFVLSGFVICSAYSDKIATGRDLMRFQFLRFGRLYPLHLVFLMVFVVLELLKYVAQIRYGIVSPNGAPFSENNSKMFFEHLFLLHPILPYNNVADTFNAPSWSIGVEFYTYFLFGMILLFARRLKNYVFGFFALASLALIVMKSTYGCGLILRCFAGFFVGCLTAECVKISKITVPTYFSAAVFVAIFLFLGLKTTTRYDAIIFFLSALLIFCLLCSEDGAFKKIMRHKLLVWLGVLSYSIYMSHKAVLWFVNQFFRVILKRPEVIGEYGISVPQLSSTQIIIAYLVIVVAVLFVSQFMYSFVENPLREKSRHVARHWWG